MQEKGLASAQSNEWPGASAYPSDYVGTMLFGSWQKEFTNEAGREVARLIRAGPEPALKLSRFLTL